jgi:sec-independent protein translocase protein TatC
MHSRDNFEMPFLDHLEELRTRLFWIAGSLFVAIVGAFFLMKPLNLFEAIQSPLKAAVPGVELQLLALTDALSITLRASLILGALLASPIIIYHLWAFLAPGLQPKERRVLIPVFSGGVLLFIGGVALCFFIVLPASIKFLAEFGADAFAFNPVAREYFGFVFAMCIAFGLVFELPMVVLALSALGIVNARLLNRLRRYAIVVLLVLSALITPDANPVTMLLMFVPLYVLYEISVLVGYVLQRHKEKATDAGS